MENKIIKEQKKKYLLAILFMLLMLPFTSKAQNNLADSIQLSAKFFESDLVKAKSLLTINEEALEQEPDSIKYMYYYYTASVLYLNDEGPDVIIKNLLSAKNLLETSLGIYRPVYFEIVNAIGEQFYRKGNIEDAKIIWEEGLIKGLNFLSYKNKFGENINNIRDNLSDLYYDEGNVKFASWIDSYKPIGSFEYACDLLEKVMRKESDNPQKNLSLLNEALDIFLNSGEDGELLLGILYQEYLVAYAYLNNEKELLKIVELWKDGKIKKLSYDDYAKTLFQVIGIFTITHFEIDKALNVLNIIKQEKSHYSPDVLSQISYYENTLPNFIELDNKIDSLNLQLNTNHSMILLQEADTSFELASAYIKAQKYSKGIEVADRLNLKLKNSDYKYSEIRFNVLLLLKNVTLSLNNYDECEKYVLEAITLIEEGVSVNDVSDLGWMYEDLAICKMNQGKFRYAEELINRVDTLLLPVYGNKSEEYAILLHNKGRFYQLKKEYIKAKEIFNEVISLNQTIGIQTNPKTLNYLREVENSLNEQL